MTSKYDAGKEFVIWLEQWQAEVRSHVSLEPMQPEKREDDCKSGPENKSISTREDITPAPRASAKRTATK
jgi:hypothetical protein